MSKNNGTNPYKRYRTTSPGITYRLRKDGSRTYYVQHGGAQISVSGGKDRALALQAELRGRTARGETLSAQSKTLAEAASIWLPTKRDIRPATRRGYEWALRSYTLPRLGALKVGAVNADRLAAFIRQLEAEGLSPSSVHAVLMPLAQIMKFAVRKGWAMQNPFTLLTRDERPRTPQHRVRALQPDEIRRLLSAAEVLGARPAAKRDYGVVTRTALFTGLRIGELLGLTWNRVDLKEGVLRVRQQLGDRSELVDLKTEAAVRDLVLAASLVDMLRQHRVSQLALGKAGPGERVFPHSEHSMYAAFRRLREIARLGPDVTWHTLRHTFASLAIRARVDTVFLSRQLGHASPDITLRIYVHEFDQVSHAEETRAALNSQIGKILAETPWDDGAEEDGLRMGQS